MAETNNEQNAAQREEIISIVVEALQTSPALQRALASAIRQLEQIGELHSGQFKEP